MAWGDEERPPIIVRGGSLKIVSGTKKNGKPWKKVGDEYRQEQPRGKDVVVYSVRFVGGGANCRPTFAHSVRVTYALDSGKTAVVVIGRADEIAEERDKKREPVVSSTVPLEIVNDSEEGPHLLLALRGRITSVVADSLVCSNPVEVIVQPVGPKTVRFSPLAWAAGLLAGASAVYALFRFFAEDEERPPIIVRGGSLVFESGDPRHSNGKKRKSKRWKHEFGWKPDHRKGENVSRFDVSFETDTGCGVTSARKAVIAYKHRTLGSEQLALFTLRIGTDDETGRHTPVIETVETLVPEIDPEVPQTLTFRPEGSVEYIQFDDGPKCANPGVVHFDPVK